MRQIASKRLKSPGTGKSGAVGSPVSAFRGSGDAGVPPESGIDLSAAPVPDAAEEPPLLLCQ